MSERIGLYGGSFNPIHHGHLITARSVAEQLGMAQVVFLPSGTPPHKPAGALIEGQHRAAMVKLAIAGEALFEFSDFDLVRSGASYTIQTVEHFQRRLGGEVALAWIIGADSLAELTTWYRVAELVEACRIVTATRPGWDRPDLAGLRSHLNAEQVERLREDILDTPRIDISATDIRSRVAAGRSIRFLVPEPVREYIAAHRLYAGPALENDAGADRR